MSLDKFIFYVTFFLLLISCSDSPTENNSNIPTLSGFLPISSPEQQGLDRAEVQSLFDNASTLENIFSLIVIKNEYLIGEGYYNGNFVAHANPIASVTKSYTSALIGIAIKENIISSIDQKMMEFFPELDWQNMDSRKSEITIRQMLEMRSGYPWEEFTPNVTDTLINRYDWIPLIEEFQLTSDPGTQFGYSNLTTYLLDVILERSLDITTFSFAQAHLFNPLETVVTRFPVVYFIDNLRNGQMSVTPRDLAKFGLLYLNNGEYKGVEILDSNWVEESLESYSTNLYPYGLGQYFRQIEYGYLWWKATAGNTTFNFASGHGGQFIILIKDLEMVIVVTADDLFLEFDEEAARKQMAIFDLVGQFISSL